MNLNVVNAYKNDVKPILNVSLTYLRGLEVAELKEYQKAKMRCQNLINELKEKEKQLEKKQRVFGVFFWS